ncbi:MAG: hypothetical protein JNN01_04925 [Opitutaceae bacterium]|nr:hypothetical protein [Opitutaceae bacterium]
MNARSILLPFLSLFTVATVVAQPSFVGPVPDRTVVTSAAVRRQAYEDRIHEALAWRSGLIKADAPLLGDMAAVATQLALRQDIERCNRTVIEHSKEPGSGPFWMFPAVAVAYLGRDQLSAEARAALRGAWSSTMQLRGDTENHWCMYYSSLYLMAQLYPNEPGSSWYTGKSSSENLQEARDYLIHWMKLATTIGQGEYTCSHYIGEYAIPLVYLTAWAEDPAMRTRARMMLDWILADQFANSLEGVLHGPNARSEDVSVVERWNALSSYFSWQMLGNTPTPSGYGGWGIYFAVAARYYDLPEVIYRIGVDRSGDFLQRDLKRTRRRWRNSDVEMAPIYKTNYSRREYAVGSTQGGLSDPIQTHVWDVTWAVPDPRGAHNTMFSLHPISSSHDMMTYFAELPDRMTNSVTKEGKVSYDSPDKFLGSSRFEQVFQDLDSVIALYDIPPGTRFPHINGFFSTDLKDLTEDSSGWIFARGGDAYLAYRPLAPYEWQPVKGYKSSWVPDRVEKGDRRLYSPHLKNGTIVQAASVSEFASMEAFQAAIRALPLSYRLEPVPTVTWKTLRGKTVVATYGKAPVVNGKTVDYSRWKLFEGPYLNAEKGSQKLTLTHGRLERVLDFNTLTIADRVKPE